MKLYTFFRSSGAYRVRIALNLKSIKYDSEFIHLRRDGGEHKKADYLEVNPQGLVPALEDQENVFIQSLAILEYLDECYPEPSLLPNNAADRAIVRSMAQVIACEIHPLNNLRVLQYLRETLQQKEDSVETWIQHWVALGFQGLEGLVSRHNPEGTYCFGNSVTMADVCLVPQYFNAKRFNCDLSLYPRLTRIVDALKDIQPFALAAPGKQPDAE